MTKYTWKPPVELQDDEPWFFIRGQDQYAINGVTGYAQGIQSAILDAEERGDEERLKGLRIIAAGVERVYENFRDWQEDNADLVKSPD